MFDNIGGKIKSLAKVVTWIGIVCSIIAGIAVLANADSSISWVGILIIPGGIVISWISSLTLYGFGELVANSSIIAEAYKNHTPSDSNLDKLEEWHQKGLITDEEYESQKAVRKEN